jgi:uncharacterized protein YdeI (YjbR/CyaY-like superfamily)
MEVLIASRLMTDAGLKAFSFRKESRSNIYSHEKAPEILSSDFEVQFKKNAIAWEFFEKQAPSYKKVMIHWIMTAKQEKTRLSRLEKTIQTSEQQKRMQ